MNRRTAYARDGVIMGTPDQIDALIMAARMEGIWTDHTTSIFVRHDTADNTQLRYTLVPVHQYWIYDNLWRRLLNLARKMGLEACRIKK